MDQAQIATLLYAVVLGLLTLWSYLMFLGALEGGKRIEAWAAFGTSTALFYVWCVTATLAAAGFLVFLGYYLTMDSDGTVYFALAWVPVSLFLAFSTLYAPLLFYGHRALVLVTLVGAALSAVCLAVFAFQLFGAVHPAFMGAVLLAGHCLFMDAGVWAFTW